MLSYRNNKLFIDGVPVESLCRKHGTPLYIYSKAQLLNNYRSFNAAFNGVPHLVCYALKANSSHALLKLLSGAGAGVDITSGGELYRSLASGFKPEKIVYAGIGKTTEEITYALKTGVMMLNMESIEELEQINRIAGRLGKKAPVAFRVNPNVNPDTHRYITTGKSGNKFGIPLADAVGAYKRASELPNIEIVGIHCHIGSQITKVKPFELAALRIRSVVDKLNTAGIYLKYIDLGGGLGITYDKETPPSPRELKNAVVPVFRDFSGTLVFEPGRYIAGNAAILAAKVVYRKSSGGKNFLIVDTAMNDLIRPTLYEAYHGIIPVRSASGSKVKVDIVGPICESGDFLGKNRMLPRVEQGGYLAVKCAGAYGFAMSSQYNSRGRAAEVLVDRNKYKVIRDRESYKDLVVKEK
ncbi:MAG: diaminopimelate decarboxylase [Elusimicrobiota bacterium]